MTTARLVPGAALLAALAVPAGAATICVNPAVGVCQSTIQGGVNTAVGGDTVLVAAGTYLENVTIPGGKDGLVLAGASKLTVILDPDVPNAGTGVTIQSANVTVRNFTIRNGQAHGIDVQANGAIVSGMRIIGVRGGSSNAINVAATFTGHQILLNEIRSARNNGILLAGTNDNSVIKGNLISNTGLGIGAAGANIQVLSNRLQVVQFGAQVAGSLAVITGNTMEAVLAGLAVNGNNPIVQANRVTAAFQGGGVTCTACTGGTFALNQGTGTTIGFSASADAAGFTFNSNKVAGSIIPFQISGTGIQGSLNSANGGGTQGATLYPCFTFAGSGHTFSRNTVMRCGGPGYLVNGTNITLDQNSSSFANSAGFQVNGNAGANSGVVLTKNKDLGANGEGFAVYNGATGTTLTGNTAIKHRVDYCDNTGSSSASGNTFTTTSTTCDVLQ